MGNGVLAGRLVLNAGLGARAVWYGRVVAMACSWSQALRLADMVGDYGWLLEI